MCGTFGIISLNGEKVKTLKKNEVNVVDVAS